ncbi:hypothetical protein F7230_02520 [Corynebacterium sp. 320]|uniref:DUF559 domain-containing protein n=1 Tax=Corynebacterium zhongnanshanii TaxID=2768834 RepID=A0ABQ6VFS9_9CORY|nr:MULTISPECIES: hypothetical protein [Corynebacterium]KAB1503998.1 hypothetical protein F7230_02520 [Corynebacterium sp. 320]KAB1552903.1 hypothetical protein F7233_04075 [Corynebacterium sp. 321]KAB1553879.1 hypothetical protein F7232_02510 [Corynebacterium sp. 319]KAB3523153.1 hypothetical protein F8377_03125 [Corynebacterium zhongnanshanii]KAB3528134.1 hypothetical protein F8354_02520 [Corynebacterium sp. 250]
MTSVAHTIVDVARWESLEAAVVMGDYALKRGLLKRSELEAALGDARGCSGIKRAQHLSGLVSSKSESPRESELKVQMWEEGLPAPLQQAVICRADNGLFVARADYLFEEEQVAVEYDGEGKYRGQYSQKSLQEVLLEERRRQTYLENLGICVIRVERQSFRNGLGVRDIRSALESRKGLCEPKRFVIGGGELAWRKPRRRRR